MKKKFENVKQKRKRKKETRPRDAIRRVYTIAVVNDGVSTVVVSAWMLGIVLESLFNPVNGRRRRLRLHPTSINTLVGTGTRCLT